MKITARKLYYAMPPAWRFTLRRLYYLPYDSWQWLAGRREPLTPPKGLIYTGSGDFKREGERALSFFKHHCQLLPSHQVLDIGSGIGRIAVPLTGYLDSAGSYEGFDVVETGVKWCREHISSRHPNFRFQYIPLDNDLYRQEGHSAANFKFPYPENSFHLAIASSLFTHMLPAEVLNYLGEIRRVLKPGGRCYATFFLFDHETKWPEEFTFPYNYGHYRLMDEQVKSANVAFDASFIFSALTQNRLSLCHFFPGYWHSGRKQESAGFQDIVVIEK